MNKTNGLAVTVFLLLLWRQKDQFLAIIHSYMIYLAYLAGYSLYCVFGKTILPERIYYPITAMGFSSMFAF